MNVTIRPTQAVVIVALTTDKGGMLDSCRVALPDLESALADLIQTHKLDVHPTSVQMLIRQAEQCYDRSEGVGTNMDLCDRSWRPVIHVVLV